MEAQLHEQLYSKLFSEKGFERAGLFFFTLPANRSLQHAPGGKGGLHRGLEIETAKKLRRQIVNSN